MLTDSGDIVFITEALFVYERIVADGMLVTPNLTPDF